MKSSWKAFVLLVGLGVLFALPASAALHEVKPGVFADDLQPKSPDPLKDLGEQNIYELAVNPGTEKHKTKMPQVFAVVRDEGEDAVHLKGGFHTQLFYQGKPFKDFVFEVDVKKTRGSYAGVVVRDYWRVYFQMRGFLCLNTSMPGRSTGMLLKSDKTYRGYHKLKVVCAGPQLHAYVDDIFIFSYEIPDKPGKLGIYAHHGEAYYRNLQVDTHVPPAAFFAVKPKAPNDSLVFSPGAAIRLAFDVSNSSESEQSVTVAATVRDWEGKALSKEAQQTVKAARGTTEVVLDMGKLPTGFHCVTYKATLDGKSLTTVDGLPLAVQERGDGAFRLPVLPVAAYSKYFNKTEPIYHNTYQHAIARSLKDHGFNAIVADPFFTREGIDIFQSYGIATIARSAAFLDHPAVIGTLAGDEPKPEHLAALKKSYDEVAAKSGKFITTCLVGEGMGLGGERGPISIWRKLDAKVRAFRWYGIKKSHYDLLYHLKYKGILPLGDSLTIAELSSDTPWWFVPPSFGRTDHEGYYKNPTPAQMRGLMHMAMAHGADGLMLWCLQSWGRWPALIGQKSLVPPDGKYEAAGEAAKLIGKHADLLASLRYGYFDVRNSNPVYVEAVPRRAGKGEAYIYVFNKDAFHPASTRIAFKGSGGARDVFSGKNHQAAQAGGGLRAVELTLPPCEAALLKVDAVVPPARPVKAYEGAPGLNAGLAARVAAKVKQDGVAILSAKMSATPCLPGDAIGLFRADDPRDVWKKSQPEQRCFSWSGLLHPRMAEGYLSLTGALRLADAADAKTPFWTVFPAGKTKPTPAELRAMIHLALAHGSKAVLVSEAFGPELTGVVEETARMLAGHGPVIAGLKHGGLDVRCKNAMVSVIPRQPLEKGSPYVYAVNLDCDKAVTADVLLWDDVWDWTTARDVFAGKAFEVKPRDKEGYLSVTITLKPGEGKLIETDAKINRKK